MSINRPHRRFLIAILSAASLALTSSAVLAQSGNPGRGAGRQTGSQIVKPPQRVQVQRPQQQVAQPVQPNNPNPNWNQSNQGHQHWNRNSGQRVNHDPWAAPHHYPTHQDPWAAPRTPWGVPQYPGPHADLPQPGTYPVSPYYSPYGPGWYQGPMGPGNYANPHGGFNQPYADQPRNSSGYPTFQNY